MTRHKPALPGIVPIAEGFAAHPYAPRSTLDTMRSTSFTRHLIPPNTQPRACAGCGNTVYWINEVPEHADAEGNLMGESHSTVDADPDVAGVAPVPPSLWGSGIIHTLLCGVPRPLPDRSPDQMATQQHNWKTPKARVTSRDA